MIQIMIMMMMVTLLFNMRMKTMRTTNTVTTTVVVCPIIVIMLVILVLAIRGAAVQMMPTLMRSLASPTLTFTTMIFGCPFPNMLPRKHPLVVKSAYIGWKGSLTLRIMND